MYRYLRKCLETAPSVLKATGVGKWVLWGLLLLSVVVLVVTPRSADAASAREINASVDTALDLFHEKVPGSHDLLRKAKGVLVMPRVIKAGLVLGGEYGEGALRIHGQTVDYYNVVSASYGFQLGAQKKAVILLFMEDTALQKFRESSGWEAGVDASVALIKLGAEDSINSTELNKPILGFVIGQTGLMYNLSLEGTKFTKIRKKR